MKIFRNFRTPLQAEPVINRMVMLVGVLLQNATTLLSRNGELKNYKGMETDHFCRVFELILGYLVGNVIVFVRNGDGKGMLHKPRDLECAIQAMLSLVEERHEMRTFQGANSLWEKAWTVAQAHQNGKSAILAHNFRASLQLELAHFEYSKGELETILETYSSRVSSTIRDACALSQELWLDTSLSERPMALEALSSQITKVVSLVNLNPQFDLMMESLSDLQNGDRSSTLPNIY